MTNYLNLSMGILSIKIYVISFEGAARLRYGTLPNFVCIFNAFFDMSRLIWEYEKSAESFSIKEIQKNS